MTPSPARGEHGGTATVAADGTTDLFPVTKE